MSTPNGQAPPPPPDLKKYRQAAYAFFIFNLIYAVVFTVYLRVIDYDVRFYGYAAVFVLFVGLLAWFVHRGAKMLTAVLAVLYGIRSLVSIAAVIRGGAFPAVPYVIPCLALTFLFCARAAWDWPPE